MTELSITASQVSPSTGVKIENGTAGATIVAGDLIFLDPATNTYKLFDANLTAANTEQPRIALNSAAAGQPVAATAQGTVTLGAAAAPVQGTPYFASGTAGKLCTAGDLVTGWKGVIVGFGGATNTIKLIPSGNSGILVG